MIDESIFDQMNETDQDDVASEKSIFGDEFVRRGISKDVIIDLTTVSHKDVSIAGKSTTDEAENLDADAVVGAEANLDIDLTEAESLVSAGSAGTTLTTIGDVPEPGTISLFGERAPLPKLVEPDHGADSEALKKIAALPVGESLFDRPASALPVSDSDAAGTAAPIDFVPVEDSSFGPWWLRPMLVVGARTALAGAAVVALVTFWPSGETDSELETTRQPLTSTTVVATPTPETSVVVAAATPSTLLTPVTTLAIATAEVAATDAPAPAPAAATPTTVRRRAVTTQPPATAAPTTTVVVSTTVVATSPPPTFGTSAQPVTTVTPTTAAPVTAAPTSTPVTAAPTSSAVTAAPTSSAVTAAPVTIAPATSAIADEAGE